MDKETSQKNNTVVPEYLRGFSEDSIISQKQVFDKEEETCRICMEREAPSLRLISPCRCRGSMKYIHEECLKTWLVSLDSEIEKGQCELCKTEFNMEVKIKRKCSPMNVCREGLSQCLTVPLFITVMGMLFLIVYLLFDKYAEYDDGQVDGYTLVLLAICSFSGFIVIILIVHAIREACTTTNMSEWTIHNQKFEDSGLEENSNIVENEDRNLSSLIMVMPRNVRVHGKKVRTPNLRPPMTPVIRGNRAVAFTPANFVSALHTLQINVVSVPTLYDGKDCCNSVPR